ncbi:hypothetical protein J2045_003352 [Peteryoungia aggregata LMG 23059]|uniref:Uncharacterized protein n=1 Tax=Peteryoungia aggregata LMG 23059 TaxID=1368425 RepID=A0ABU0GBJ1_9HYPH|nr:hypothetical protein [Peteryoungia aggregata]MDQ0422304.1 hypothetical protein [Peteryoungia aggregata LMG 23059]
MTKFTIITGKALASAIKGRAAQVETFKEREHQLATSCLHHVEQHSDVVHLNGLLSVTPANYRRGLVLWAVAYGKVTYDAKERVFAFAKGKKSDLPGAESVAPADYEKAAKTGGDKTAKTLMERLENAAAKTIKDEAATPEDLALAKALAAFLQHHKRAVVVDMVKAKATAKTPAKAKAPAKPAPVATQEAPQLDLVAA